MTDVPETAIVDAIERFERETGRKLAAELPGESDLAIIGVFLVLNGYQIDPDQPPNVIPFPADKSGRTGLSRGPQWLARPIDLT